MSLPSRYPVPARLHRVEQVIQRSRFITTVDRATTPEEARAFVDRIREEFPDATHNCWAYAVGPPGDTAMIGMSDDGEPHGTAGRPMLTVLLHGPVGEIAAVVTRYFGGVKLGKGGLVRAYSAGVREALETLPTVERVERVEVRITVGYESVDGLRRILDELDTEVREEVYGASVTYRVGVPDARAEELRAAVAGLTNGQGRVEEGDPDPHRSDEPP